MKARYLAFYSYIGTSFRSSEKLWFKDGKKYPDPESVQGLMEIALLKLRSLNYPSIILSSRTDGGVHAINTSAHFDLEKYGSGIYDPSTVAFQINKFFLNNSPIFVKKCIRVPDNFHARFNAISRTYLYSLYYILLIPPSPLSSQFFPGVVWKRSLFSFDIERFKEGAKYFVGYHDFSTFKRHDKLNPHKHNRREILSIDVRPGKPLLVSNIQGRDNVFHYFDIEIKGKAFVHNQIRRMIGTLNTVATGKLQPEDVKVMLQIPSKHSWHSFIQNCPPDGLYLCNVEYNPEDLIYDDSVTENKDIINIRSGTE
ncbi:hypothetical protein K1T71_003694 [Dendrolimus kikuchii]|uniref:Uncharacterized protein n=1 Tax=Dendrolimus kikuchii TaxID=765133 RepID=A0ACC1D8Y1_9NEOP|nr:hypothetical protein K1T71_003694 [Dendrolimus kikuchii]